MSSTSDRSVASTVLEDASALPSGEGEDGVEVGSECGGKTAGEGTAADARRTGAGQAPDSRPAGLWCGR